eukprot:sb/3473569/
MEKKLGYGLEEATERMRGSERSYTNNRQTLNSYSVRDLIYPALTHTQVSRNTSLASVHNIIDFQDCPDSFTGKGEYNLPINEPDCISFYQIKNIRSFRFSNTKIRHLINTQSQIKDHGVSSYREDAGDRSGVIQITDKLFLNSYSQSAT